MGSRHGKLQRQIGDRFERKVVALISASEYLEAERVPNSGANGGSFSGDIVWRKLHVTPMSPPRVRGVDRRIECKRRQGGFKQIYSWLEGNDALVIGADRKEPLIVLPLSEWIKQVGGE